MDAANRQGAAYLQRLVDGAASLRSRDLIEQLDEFWLVGVGAIDAMAAADLISSEEARSWLSGFARLCNRDVPARPTKIATQLRETANTAETLPAGAATAQDFERIVDASRGLRLANLQRVVTLGPDVDRRSPSGLGISSVEFYDDAVVVRWTIPKRAGWRPGSPSDPEAANPVIALNDDVGTFYTLVASNLSVAPGETIRGESIYLPRRSEARELTISCEGTSWSVPTA